MLWPLSYTFSSSYVESCNKRIKITHTFFAYHITFYLIKMQLHRKSSKSDVHFRYPTHMKLKKYIYKKKPDLKLLSLDKTSKFDYCNYKMNLAIIKCIHLRMKCTYVHSSLSRVESLYILLATQTRNRPFKLPIYFTNS